MFENFNHSLNYKRLKLAKIKTKIESLQKSQSVLEYEISILETARQSKAAELSLKQCV